MKERLASWQAFLCFRLKLGYIDHKDRIITDPIAKFIEEFRHYRFLYSLGGIAFIKHYYDWVRRKEEVEAEERKAV